MVNLLQNRDLERTLSHTDGLVGALTEINNETFFITSPNTKFIPAPISSTDLILRTNHYYGTDDFLLWPQPYNPDFCHLSVVRRPPPASLTATEEPDWMIWEPYSKEYFTWDEGDNNCVIGYGRLEGHICEKLSESVDRLLSKTKVSETSGWSLPEKSTEFLNISRLHLEFIFARLKEMPCTPEQAGRGWVELSRAWLALDSLWSFFSIYRRRIQGHLPAPTHNSWEESRLIGSFTHDEKVAGMFYLAGIPVWLIRPIRAFTTQNIRYLVDIKSPNLCMDFSTRAVTHFIGHPGSTQKFTAIQLASHEFCLHPDPFEISSASHKLNSPKSKQVLDRKGHKHHPKERFERRYFPYHTTKVQHFRGTNSNYDTGTSQHAIKKTNRDKFSRYEGNFAPLSLPAWADANQRLDRNSLRYRNARKHLKDKGYFFPDPGLFFGVEQDWKAAAYFRQWAHIKEVWMLRIFSKSATPCTSQQWRDILALGILDSRKSVGATHEEGEEGEMMQQTASRKGIGMVRDLISDCLSATGLKENSLVVSLTEEQIRSQIIDIKSARICIWELCEFNFRWELQALDRRLYDQELFDPLYRQMMLLECFATEYNGLTSVHFRLARTGLASPSFPDRFPYLQALWRLMEGWGGNKPSGWRCVPISRDPFDCDHWEKMLTQYYAQTFFDYFSRPAILPCTLHADDIS